MAQGEGQLGHFSLADRFALRTALALVGPSSLPRSAYLPYVKYKEGVAVGSLILSNIIYAREVPFSSISLSHSSPPPVLPSADLSNAHNSCDGMVIDAHVL